MIANHNFRAGLAPSPFNPVRPTAPTVIARPDGGTCTDPPRGGKGETGEPSALIFGWGSWFLRFGTALERTGLLHPHLHHDEQIWA